MELLQSQVQRLNQQQLQSVELLQMSTLELEAHLRDLAQENPLIEMEEPHSEPSVPKDDELLRRLRWLEDNDRQNHYYQRVDDEEFDPLTRAGCSGGLEETLVRFLSRQLDRMDLSAELRNAVTYLAACLDDGGYFRLALDDLAEHTGAPLPLLEQALEVLRSLEPAGVGAASLSQCLELQLLRIGETGPALAIVRDHLDALAKRHYRAIATKLSISQEEVQAAQAIIRELDPRPGAVFEQPGQIQYVLPDIYVTEVDGRFQVQPRTRERAPFQINVYYRNLLAQSQDKEVREYLTGKLRQAENLLWAIGQRDSTLVRCAQAIVEHQQNFFRLGPQALTPMRMVDLAQELGIHESTVSRTVREKYLQCARGVYPLNYFFSRSATAADPDAAVGSTAARALLQRLIREEDPAHPLSDQKLCDQMALLGCAISRRTVAKYREEMNIPGASGRKNDSKK